MKNNKPVVLVTGGAGYIGSHICKALDKAGYLPVTYDNLSEGYKEAVKWGPLEEGDVQDQSRLSEVLVQYQPIAVMHFAAFIAAGESVENPGKYYQNNVAGSLSLIEAVVRQGVDKFIFSSTAAVYGMPVEIPITESHPQQPINPYGHSKQMVEQILRDFGVAHGLKSICLRYFNAAGADPEGETGEAHDPETHLIPLVLDAVSGRRECITVYGTDYDTPDGTCIRDYIHVSDLADAHVLALQSLESGVQSTAYNLGNGAGFSVMEIIEAVKRVTGRDVPVAMGDRREGDPSRLVADSTKIIDELGWEPKYPDIESIIQTAWGWHQKTWEQGARSKEQGARS
ncbi:MAG: UDP-glucose 4-epimerase GalE [Nitrosomonadaceae bacterium]